MELFFFYIFALVAVGSAIAVITIKNPVHSAFYLIICLVQVAALFVLLRAPFLAAVQVFIYVGAVVVLFLFAVMVLDLGREVFKGHLHDQWVVGAGVAAFLVFVLGYFVLTGKLTAAPGPYTEEVLARNTEVIGKQLYTKFIFPFEVVSLLLLIALVGAIVLVLTEKGKKS